MSCENLDQESSEDIDNVSFKKMKVACCKSYLQPKGRCFDCVEDK